MKRIILIHVCLLILFSATAVIQDKNMPVIVVNPEHDIRAKPVAIIISGDRGWYGFEQGIADSLAAEGVPTIGLDTRKYFWNRRTPEETATDIAKCISQHNMTWQRSRFIFIGYSLGAELVPFIVNKLPETIRSSVTMIVLLSPAATTDFQVHYSDMLGIGSRHDTYKVTDEIDRIKTIPILLIFGADEKTVLPGMLTGTPVTLVKVPGDHSYNHDSLLIFRTMKEHNAF